MCVVVDVVVVMVMFVYMWACWCDYYGDCDVSNRSRRDTDNRWDLYGCGSC